jgi:hypothetical protein
MRLSRPISSTTRRPPVRDFTRRTDRMPLRAGALITAFLGAVAPSAARARLSDSLSTLSGSLADHSEIGGEQSVGEVMASLDAMMRALEEASPDDRATMAAAFRRAREL